MRPIMNIAEVEFTMENGNGDRYQSRMAMVGGKIGAQKLGYNVTAVPPGKRAFPLHVHRFNEEMFFILQGEGELQFGEERHAVKPGDVIACPPGGSEHAHQIVNTGSVELRYLAVSTKMSPELVEYPNTGKFGVLAEYPNAATGKSERFRYVGLPDGGVDYWEGE